MPPALLITSAALGAVATLLYGGGLVTYDTAYALSWGADIAHGRSPSYDVPLPPTPHPLTNLAGVILSPFGGAAMTGAAALGALSMGALAAISAALGHHLAGPIAGAAAAILVVSREPILFSAGLSYLDVPYAALVLAAVLFEVQEPRRPTRVLVLLLLAGLLRPEAWLLSVAYLGWLWFSSKSLPALGQLALGFGPPILWLAHDLALTGDPLYSFTLTTGLTEELGRATGVAALPRDLPLALANVAKPAVAFGAVVGAVIALRHRSRTSMTLLTAAVGATAATALVVAGGTPLNMRYLLAAPAIACVFAGAGIAALGHRGVAQRILAGLVVAAVGIGALADRGNYRESRDALAREDAALEELRQLASAVGSTRCRRTVAASRLAPYISVWTNVPANQVVARGPSSPRGTIIAPTSHATARSIVRQNSDSIPGRRWKTLEPVREGRFWSARRAGCGADG